MYRTGARGTSALLLSLALLQAVFFALSRELPSRSVIGLGLGIITWLEWWSPFVFRLRPRTGLWLLTALASANFGASIAQAAAAFPWRMLHVVILLGYALALVVFAAGPLPHPPRILIVRLASGAAVLLAAAEFVLGLRMPLAPPPQRVQWEWVSSANTAAPVALNVPGTEVRGLYASDPDGYFDDPEAFRRGWVFDRHGDLTAGTMEFARDAVRAMRVAVVHASPDSVWKVQLNDMPIVLRAKATYVVSFRARSSHARSLTVGLAQAHGFWEGLGFYQRVEVGTAWQRFSNRTTLQRGDTVARLHFDLAADTGSIELADIEVREASSGRRVEVVPPRRHEVRYRFNEAGCRGPGFSRAPAAGTRRVLVLGDSYALGVGVHEEDTFAAQLAMLLDTPEWRERGSPVTEVMNCGMRGFNLSDERLFYEREGRSYAPTVVVLTVSANDDSTRRLDRTAAPPATRNLERLFLALRLVRVERARAAGPLIDTSGLADALRRIQASVQESGARLLVVLFRQSGAKEWSGITEAVADATRGTGSTVLDLGPSLVAPPRSPGDFIDEDAIYPGARVHAIAAKAIARVIGDGLPAAAGGPPDTQRPTSR